MARECVAETGTNWHDFFEGGFVGFMLAVLVVAVPVKLLWEKRVLDGVMRPFENRASKRKKS